MNPILDNLLVIDIETVPIVEKHAQLDSKMQEHWDKKSVFFRNEEERSSAELFEDRGGIYAEFGKVICIGLGYFTYSGNDLHFRATYLANHEESSLLSAFNSQLAKFPKENLKLCAHNGKEFDYPFLCRRMLINDLDLPEVLQISGKKPWEVALVDTMELWKFGDRKSFTSLDLLASIFNIESSKSDIDGSQVAHVYYNEGNLEKIGEYCVNDVIVTAQVFLKLNQLNILPAANIQRV